MSDDTTHWDDCATEGGPEHYECAVAKIARLTAERDAALADAQRFVWCFGDSDKSAFVVDRYLAHLCGLCSIDEWRAAIDKAMGGDSPK